MRLRLLLLGAALVALTAVLMPALAQDETDSEAHGVCDVLFVDALDTAQTVCGTLEAGQVCVASDAIELEGATATAGELIDIRDITAARTISNDEARGLLLLKAPNEGDSAVRMTLYGEAELTNLVQPLPNPLPTLTVTNAAGYDVNVRSGPGRNFNVIGVFDETNEVIADGRDSAGEWVRIQLSDGAAWVHQSLIAADGDIQALAVIDSPYTLPMQQIALRTGAGVVCGADASGLLLEQEGEAQSVVNINGVELRFNDATLLVQSGEDNILKVQVVAGTAEVVALDVAQTAETGQSVQVALAEDGLTAIAAPQVDARYSFATIGSAPLELVADESLACIAGLGYGDGAVTVYNGPGVDYGVKFDMTLDVHYPIIGYALDDDNQLWLSLDTGRGQSWVPQNDVRTVGVCGNLVAIDPPPPVSTGNIGGSDNVSYLPQGQSVWQAESGPDVMTGTCNTPPLALCAHLAAIITNPDGSIQWRGQEPAPYTLQPTGPNSFFYQGRNHQNNGTVTLNLTLTSESTWSLEYSTVWDEDPQCTHTYYYTATRQW